MKIRQIMLLLLVQMLILILNNNKRTTTTSTKAWDAVKLTPAWNAVITSQGQWLPLVQAGCTPPEGPSGVVTGLP